MDEIERDVIKNSEYIIEYYKRKEKPITNLELQKLMYFLEAIYMVSTGEEYLFNEEFAAWIFGPVNLDVYKLYKKFGSSSIVLNKEVHINPVNYKYIENLYEMFKDFTVTNLVNLSHSEGSPWLEIYNESKDGLIPKDEFISKKKTKKWFSSLVVKGKNE